ncbi:hypothetical protein L9F63_027704, partial [Diploptera punctata]
FFNFSIIYHDSFHNKIIKHSNHGTIEILNRGIGLMVVVIRNELFVQNVMSTRQLPLRRRSCQQAEILIFVTFHEMFVACAVLKVLIFHNPKRSFQFLLKTLCFLMLLLTSEMDCVFTKGTLGVNSYMVDKTLQMYFKKQSLRRVLKNSVIIFDDIMCETSRVNTKLLQYG